MSTEETILPVVNSSRRQSWLARGCFVALIGLSVALKVFGLDIAEIDYDNTTIYRWPRSTAVGVVVVGSICLIVGTMYWRTASWFFRIVGCVLFVAGIALIFALLPTLLANSVEVTPDQFTSRTGFWFSPTEYVIDLPRLAYIQVVEDETAERDWNERASYNLDCVATEDGQLTSVPINSFVRKALPNLYSNLVKHGVMILESPDGSQMPPE